MSEQAIKEDLRFFSCTIIEEVRKIIESNNDQSSTDAEWLKSPKSQETAGYISRDLAEFMYNK